MLSVCLLGLLVSSVCASSDVFTENLFIRPLSTGHVYAHFEFKTLYNKKLISLNYGESAGTLGAHCCPPGQCPVILD